MFRVNKHVNIRITPHQVQRTDLVLLSTIEEFLNFRPLSHLEYKEVKSDNKRTRRFFVKAAFTQRDK